MDNQTLRRLGLHLIDAELKELADAAGVKLPRYEWDFDGVGIDAIKDDGVELRFNKGSPSEVAFRFPGYELDLFVEKRKASTLRKLAEIVKRWS